MRIYHLCILLLFCLAQYILVVSALAQTPTIGLLFSTNQASDGYTLFSPESNEQVYLIDNCGEKINAWTFTQGPELTCYLREDGTLLRAGQDSLEIRDWDNTLLWSYALTANGLAQHHDIAPLPNGNILCLLHDDYSAEQMIAAGRAPANVAGNFRIDKIVELQPSGAHEATIVWEWTFMDHFIQELDSTKNNYGIVVEHPELLHLNFDNNRDSDFTHCNAIDYHPELDQILITSRHLSEIYIIDHSTTTEEAASHTGGNSNQGGGFLWRWGNPQVYQQGDATDQKLFLPHDAKWVPSGYLDAGQISVFNNGGNGTNTFSAVHLISTAFENQTYLKENQQFIPIDFSWTWSGDILGHTLYETKKSGAHALPNGNFIICESSLGQVSEITKTGEHLWTYRNPTGYGIYEQYGQNHLDNNTLFRAEKYPGNFPGFAGQDLSPKGIVENENPVAESCVITSVAEEVQLKNLIVVNPVTNHQITFSENVSLDAVRIFDTQGKLVYQRRAFQGKTIPTRLNPSIYFLQLVAEGRMEVRKVIVL